MTEAVNVNAYVRTTNRSWDEWVAQLDGQGARELIYSAIVPLVEKDLESLPLKNRGWWAQGITIAYEQHIGRRVPGQRSDGTFACSVSKTVAGTMDDALAAWVALVNKYASFRQENIVGDATQSSTPRWRYWRCSLDDGSRVTVAANEPTPNKVRLAVDHSSLVSPEESVEWKSFWKEMLGQLME